MNEISLKYGCNPNQSPSRIFMEDGKDLPVEILSGRPGYINFLDAFNGWQLVSELKEASVNMFTTVFIGNSTTEIIDGRLVTKRGYPIEVNNKAIED